MSLYNFVLRHDSVFELALGFALVFAGSWLMNRFRSGKKAPPLARFIICTAFTYGVTVLRELVQFFTDYYNEESEWQDYSFVPEDDFLFFELFGQGSAQAGQYHVMDTDLDFLCMMIGCAAGGALLLIFSTLKAKKSAGKAISNETKAENVYAE